MFEEIYLKMEVRHLVVARSDDWKDWKLSFLMQLTYGSLRMFRIYAKAHIATQESDDMRSFKLSTVVK